MARNAACSVAAAVLIASFIAGCRGGGTKTTVRTVTASEPTRAVITGDGPLDQVIAAALVSDDIELAGLAGYQKIACRKDSAQRPGDPPACRETEADGALVEVLPVTACEGGWVRPEQVPDAFRAALRSGTPRILAVFKPRATPAAFGGGFGAEQVVVFRTGTHPDTQPQGVALHIKNGRVVRIESDCRNVLLLIASEKVDAFIIDPRGTVTPPTPTPQTPAPSGTPAQ